MPVVREEAYVFDTKLSEVKHAKHNFKASRDALRAIMKDATQEVSDEFTKSQAIVRNACADSPARFPSALITIPGTVVVGPVDAQSTEIGKRL